MSERRRAEVRVVEAALAWYRNRIGPSIEGWDQVVEELELACEALDAVPPDHPTTFAGAGHPATSHEAAKWMERYVRSQSAVVLREFLTHRAAGGPGLTADAVQIRVKGTHQSISARVHDLANKGYLIDTGRRRETRSGRRAIVYQASDIAVEAAKRAKGWGW